MSLSVLAASGCAAELAADAAVSACVAPAGDVLTSSCAVADSGRKPAPVAAIPVVSSAAIRFNFMTSRSEEHTSELQSLMRISYDVFCWKKKKKQKKNKTLDKQQRKNDS